MNLTWELCTNWSFEGEGSVNKMQKIKRCGKYTSGLDKRLATANQGHRQERWTVGLSNLRWVCWGAAGGLQGSPGLGGREPWAPGPPPAHTWRWLAGPSGGEGGKGWLRGGQRAPWGQLLNRTHPNPQQQLLQTSRHSPSGLPPLHLGPQPHGQLTPQPAAPPVMHCSLSASGWSRGEREERGWRVGWKNTGG